MQIKCGLIARLWMKTLNAPFLNCIEWALQCGIVRFLDALVSYYDSASEWLLFQTRSNKLA